MRVNPSAAFFRAPRAWAGALAAVGFAVGWFGTAPGMAMGINWDAAGYIADHASGRIGWSAPPWSSHYALGQAYLLASWVTRGLGGTFIDGARLLNAASLALSCALVGTLAHALGGVRWLSVLLALVFVSAWGTLILVFTLEDNLVFLPAALAALWIAVRQVDAWRPRDSVAAGALVGLGTLMSWQAGLYLFPALYVAVCLGGETRPMIARVRDALWLMASLLGARLAWTLFYWVTAHGIGLRALLHALFSRPEPSFFPRGTAAWIDLAVHWRSLLRRVGNGIAEEIAPGFRDAAIIRQAAFAIGAGAVAVLTALFAGSAVHAQRRGVWAPLLVAATLLAFAAATAL